MADIKKRGARERHWQGKIEAQRASGKSVRVFCKGEQISPSVFYAWKKRLELKAKGQLGGRFIKVRDRGMDKAPSIHLPNGVKIELGAGLESGLVSEFLRCLCGVNHPARGGCDARA